MAVTWKAAGVLLATAVWSCAGSSGGGELDSDEITDPSPGEERRQEQELNATLALERATYPAGAPVSMTLRVENPTADPVTLRFSDGQRFDFVIREAGGDEPLWRWSSGRFFTQALGEEVVPPGDSLVYEATMEEGLEPGRYAVVGVVPARERTLRDSADVEVGGDR